MKKGDGSVRSLGGVTRPRPVDAAADTRGIVAAASGFDHFTLTRHAPAPALAWAVEMYWAVRWDLPAGETYDQRVIPHPAVHLVFEEGRAEVQAVTTDEFVRRLAGRGHVLGVKFQPAGFRPYLGGPVAAIVDRRLPARSVFGPDVDPLARRVAATDDALARAALVGGFLAGLPAAPLPMTAPVNAIVHQVARDRSITRVDDLAARLGVGTRRLQRLFAEHVGVPPKWVINRSRIHAAAEAAVAPEPVDWATLAADLGYSDQAHLVRDFTAAVGTPPARYARDAARPRR